MNSQLDRSKGKAEDFHPTDPVSNTTSSESKLQLKARELDMMQFYPGLYKMKSRTMCIKM